MKSVRNAMFQQRNTSFATNVQTNLIQKNMKIIKCIAMAFVSLVAVSCNNSEDPIESLIVKQPMSFTATIDGGPSARQDTSGRRYTHLLSNWRVFFDAGDAISVFDGNNDNRSFVTNVGGATAFFEGEAASAGTYTALYPYQPDATLDGTKLEAVLPSAQRPVLGGYDPEANLSVATTDNSEKNFFFLNACALIQFWLSGSARAVQLTITGDAAAAGEATIDTQTMAVERTGTKAVITVTDGALSSLMEYVPYYIAVWPGTYNSFRFRVTNLQNKYKVTDISVPSGYRLERGKIYDVGEVEVANVVM